MRNNECRRDRLRAARIGGSRVNRMNRNRRASIRMNSNETMSSMAAWAIVEARRAGSSISMEMGCR